MGQIPTSIIKWDTSHFDYTDEPCINPWGYSRWEGAMGRTFASLAAAAVLSACAQQQWQWVKPGAGPQEFQVASYECERDTRMSSRSFGGGAWGQVEAGNFIVRCMNAKGFYQQPVGQATAASQSRTVNAGPDHPASNLSAWASVEIAEPGTKACIGAAQMVARQYGRGTTPVSALRVREQHYGDDPKAAAYRYVEFAPTANGAALAYICGPDDVGALAAMPMPTVADVTSPTRRAVWEPWAARAQTCKANGARAAQLAACAGAPPS